VATRLGLRDALINWSLIYSIGFAMVAGFTWKGANPNSLLVLWGFSVMIAAMIPGVPALRVTTNCNSFATNGKSPSIQKELKGFLAHPKRAERFFRTQKNFFSNKNTIRVQQK
jgi:hypothetical protein